MNFLRLNLLYIYYILLHLTLAGSSFVQIGDAISVNIDSSVSYKNSSNVIRTQSNELSDGIYRFSPGALITFGARDTSLDMSLKVIYDFLEYHKYSDLDTELLKVTLNGSYDPNPILNNIFSYSYNEGENAISEFSTGAQDVLVETVTERASFLTQYNYSPKLSLSLGANLVDLSYDTHADRLAAKETFNIPIKLIYRYSEKLNIVYGVSITDTKVGERLSLNYPKYDTDSSYYNIGLNGEILPKLTGSFDLGYRTLSFSYTNKDFNSFGATSNLTWQVTPKFKTSLRASRDFDAAGSGSTYRSTNGNIFSIYTINSDYKLSLNYGRTLKFFRADAFRGTQSRYETLDSVALKLHYIPSVNYSLSAGYRYLESDAQSDYILEEYSITARVKY
jgi:hypothetical protein